MEEKGYTYKYPRPAVTTDCVIFGFDGTKLQVLLVQRGIEPFKGRWAFPGGFMNMDESAEQCAQRELMEETGMKVDKMAFLTTIATSDGFTDELIHIYMATGLTFAGSNPDADEFINVDLIKVPELIDAVLDGQIEDAKTVVGALLCDSISHRLQAFE